MMSEEEGMTADEGPAMPAADETRPDRRVRKAYTAEPWSADMGEASPAEARSTDMGEVCTAAHAAAEPANVHAAASEMSAAAKAACTAAAAKAMAATPTATAGQHR
jgi:hypothetical protein